MASPAAMMAASSMASHHHLRPDMTSHMDCGTPVTPSYSGSGGLTLDAIASREEESVVVDYILNTREYNSLITYVELCAPENILFEELYQLP